MQWAYDHLPSPSDEKQPLVYTPEQARLLVRWFRIDPATSRFVYHRGLAEMLKGWGKSPLFASVALGEFAGPVVPAGWDARGEPVGRPWGTGGLRPPWVQIAAVSEDQTDNTYSALYDMLVANEHRAAIDLGIDDGRTRLYFRGGKRGRLEPVTASSGSRSGQPVTFAVFDETQLWTPSSGGTKLASTIRANVAKTDGRSFETANAPVLGEGSVAERTGNDAEAGKPGILHYAVRPSEEPQPDWSDARLIKHIIEVKGDAEWLDPERILVEVRDPQTDWQEALRLFFNVRARGGEKAVDPRRWKALADDTIEVPNGTPVVLGFRGSYIRGATALIGCTVEERAHLFTIAMWERPPEAGAEWRTPVGEVDTAVRKAMDDYAVLEFDGVPYGWGKELEDWAGAWPDQITQFDSNQPKKFGAATDDFLQALAEGELSHDGSDVLSRHMTKAVVSQQRGYNVIAPPPGGSADDIAGAVAAVIAYHRSRFHVSTGQPLFEWA